MSEYTLFCHGSSFFWSLMFSQMKLAKLPTLLAYYIINVQTMIINWNTCSILETVNDTLSQEQFLKDVALGFDGVDFSVELVLPSNNFLINFVLLDFQVIFQTFTAKLQGIFLGRECFFRFWITTTHLFVL